MATLIPALGSVVSRMTAGERRFAERIEDKLEDDYICWYDVAIGEKTLHPDFVIFHPGRGMLVLEVKDWKLDTIRQIDKQSAVLLTGRGLTTVTNPLEQARGYVLAIMNRLERDPQLIWPTGSLKGRVFFPYGHGVVLTSITRAEFDAADLGDVLPSHLVICKDEMYPSVEAEALQQRFWDMFPYKFTFKLSLPQIDRVRWHLFPEIRMPEQRSLFADDGADDGEIPDILRVMDLQQEQLARSLGDGHRVIHGVAGSGKTMILGYRAEFMAKVAVRPILVLCYNRALAARLAATMADKGLADKVHVYNFHAWCVRQLDAYHVDRPRQGTGDAFFADMVDRVIRGVERNAIPAGQYDAVLIDEGHDFEPEWLKLVVQMVNPDSNSLLVLYDDAQAIYGVGKKKVRSFASVGIKARGRTTILKLNYRNTREILSLARAFAEDLLAPREADEDEAPTVLPVAAGRHGPRPLLIELPTPKAEIERIADILCEEHRAGTPWSDMAVVYRHYDFLALLTDTLNRRGVPFEQPQKSKLFRADTVKLMTMHSSKGLEFPLVCVPGIGMPHKNAEAAEDEARLLYVAMTRATRQLVLTFGATSQFSEKLRSALA